MFILILPHFEANIELFWGTQFQIIRKAVFPLTGQKGTFRSGFYFF
jgi:hypothetical protein